MKVVEWVGSSYRDLMDTGDDVKSSFGYALEIAQSGGVAGYAKPMKGKFRDVFEVTIPDGSGDSTYRATYTTKIGDVVYVLDVFRKKSKSGIETPQRDLDRIYRRFQMAREHYERHYRGKC